MKSSSPSLSYRWAKSAMRYKPPARLPFGYLAVAVLFGVQAFIAGELKWPPFVFLMAAFYEWQDRGYREIFAEQENRIAELQSAQATEPPRAS